MIDNVTVRFNDKPLADQIFKSQYQETMKVDHEGVIKRETFNFENLRIRSTPSFTELTGSLHTFYNIRNLKMNANYNAFCYDQIVDVLELLENRWEYPLSEMRLTNFEFGFNLLTTYAPSNLIEDNILFYNLKAPCVDPKNKVNKKIKIFVCENYIIKIYDKSKQFDLPYHVLRVEIVYRSKDLFGKMGVRTLSDFKNKDVYVALFNDLLAKLESLLIIDSYNGLDSMDESTRMQLVKFTNPNFWIDQKKNATKNRYFSNRKMLFDTIEHYKLDSIKRYLLQLLKEKYLLLLNP